MVNILARHKKTCLWGLANTKGTDQTAHPCTCTSVHICAVWSVPLLFTYWKVSFPKLSISVTSLVYLVSAAEETGLSLALSETPKTGFVMSRPIYFYGIEVVTLIKFWVVYILLSEKYIFRLWLGHSYNTHFTPFYKIHVIFIQKCICLFLKFDGQYFYITALCRNSNL